MLQRIKNNVITKFISNNSKIIICVVAALVIALALIGYFRNYRRENFNSDSKADFFMFSVDWCPHCKAAKPEFSACKNPSVNLKIINCEDDANSDLISGFNIEGYPTFALVKDGNTQYYDGERTTAGLDGWLSEKA